MIEFENHGLANPRYSIRIERSGRSTIYRAETGTYKVSVEKQEDLWIAQEVKGIGGAIIIDGLASKYEAVKWALLFIACYGGQATVDD